MIENEEKRRKERKEVIEAFLLSSQNDHIKKVVSNLDIKSMEYCGDVAYINHVEYYDDVPDLIDNSKNLVKEAFFVRVTKTEICIGTGGYSKHRFEGKRIIKDNGEWEKSESFMYSPGGLTIVYTIDENNIITYGHHAGIG